MSPPDEVTGSHHDPLDAVIAEYLQRVEAGAVPDREALLAQYPELVEGLREFFADLDRLDRQAGDLHLPGATEAAGERPHVRYFGEYELLEVVARGGMGVVYKARQQSLNRLVALKMILQGRLATPRAVARFRAEAEAAANLDHPHIVPIYEVGEHEGQQYFTMRFIEGLSLARQPRGDLRTEVRLLVTVARAVHYAHQHGILHRDIKPSNILVADGVPFVTDFGLAKRLDGTGDLTATGEAPGTPRYMAPEQAAGRKDLTVAADVYSLGVVLYERLTGTTPFRGDDILEVLRQVREAEPPRPSSLRPDLDRDLETICLKCLEKDAAKRYDSADALADDLDRWLQRAPIMARRSSAGERMIKWARRQPAVAALLLVSLLAAVGLVSGSVFFTLRLRDERDRAEERADAETRAWQAEARARQGAEVARYAIQLSLAQRELQASHVARARQVLAECRDELRHWEHAYLRHVSDSSLLTLPEGGYCVAFSPDGTRISNGHCVWDAATGQKLLTLKPGDKGYIRGVAFSPAGGLLVTVTGDLGIGLNSEDEPGEVKVWDLRTGQVAFGLPGFVMSVFCIAFSPDGTHLATGTSTRTEEGFPKAGEVKVWEVATRREVVSFQGHSCPVYALAWTPDGQHIASSAEFDSRVLVWNARTGEVVQTLPFDYHEGKPAVAFSPDGQHLAARLGPETLQVWEWAKGKVVRKFETRYRILSLGMLLAAAVAFSPDGSRLASDGPPGTIQVWDLKDGREAFTLKGHTGCVHGVAFSPDGRRLVSVADDGTVKLWDALHDPEAFVVAEPRDEWPHAIALSPDRLLVAGRAGNDPENSEVTVWNASSGHVVRRYTGLISPATSLAFSPDGRQLAGGSGELPKGKGPWRSGEVVIWDVATGRVRNTLRSHKGPVNRVEFSPSGGQLVSGSRDGTAMVWDWSAGERVFTLSKAHGLLYTPDGRQLIGGDDQGITLWDAGTGEEVRRLPGLPARVLAISSDGRCLATALKDDTIRLVDLMGGQEGLILKGHTGKPMMLEFSPDGKRLASLGKDNTVRLWDTTFGQEVLTLPDAVTVTRLGPDGRLLAGVRLWETPRSAR